MSQWDNDANYWLGIKRMKEAERKAKEDELARIAAFEERKRKEEKAERMEAERKKPLRRWSTNDTYDIDYAERNTLKDVPRGKPKEEMVANDEDEDEKKEVLAHSPLVETTRASKTISDFLKRRKYKRLAHVERDKFKPSGVAPGLKSRREQNKDKQSLIDLDRWVVKKPKKKKGSGKRRRTRKKRKRRRTKKKRKSRRRKRRRTRKY